MKKLVTGFIIGLLIIPITNDITGTLRYTSYNNKTIQSLWKFGIFPSLGISKILNGSCTKTKAKNGHGWEYISRDYFDCSKIQIILSDLIIGEYENERK